MEEESKGRESALEEKLYIEDGMRLEVLRSDNEVVFLGRVRSFEGRTLELHDDGGNSIPPAVYGTEVKLRGVWTGVGLVTYHGTVFGCNDRMWKIGELAEWYGWERRDFYRQNLAVDAEVIRTYRAHAASANDRDVKVPCKLLDVSASGALISCSKAVFMQDDQLSVTNAEIIHGEPPFSFLCTISRVEKARFHNLYGCRMEGMTIREQDRLARAVFRLQQEERRESHESGSLL